ncbi:hypothetical protein Cva_00821 [Caedimonas varicaedens]|uniref:Proline/betaine transporter n=1 Tax=Caedimonas varicaedens TaxID=1629334 RepID=A0A0K8MD79_9PROT|nr:hypothetical protein Cva_00821 [Caedimonas varicaedens]
MSAWAALLASMECVGGIFALGLAYIGETYLAAYDWGWRLPFMGAVLFVGFSAALRLYLIEAPEYTRIAHNKPLDMFDNDNMSAFYQSLTFKQKNTICLFALWLFYPVCFASSYIYMTPMVLKACGLDVNSHIISHNLLLSCLEMAFSLSWIPLVLWTNISIKVITVTRFICVMIFCSIFYYVLTYYPSQSLLLLIQGLVIGCGDFVLMAPCLFKSFSIVGRFSYMGITWSVARWTNLFIIVFGLEALSVHYGFMGIFLGAIVPLALISLVAIRYCVLNYESVGYYLDHLFNKGRKLQQAKSKESDTSVSIQESSIPERQ